MMISGKIYRVICIKSTGEQVSMVMKPRTLGLLGHSDIRNLDFILMPLEPNETFARKTYCRRSVYKFTFWET